MERCSTLVSAGRGAPRRTLTLLLLVVSLACLMGGSAFASTVRAVAASGSAGTTVQVPILFDLSSGENGINNIMILASVSADTGAVALVDDLALCNPPYGSLTPQASPNDYPPAFSSSTTTFDWNWATEHQPVCRRLRTADRGRSLPHAGDASVECSPKHDLYGPSGGL